jgi:hypothetical protein
VRQQFKMTDQQFNSLNKAHQDSWANYQKGVAGLDANLPADQRQQRLNDLQQGYHKDFSKAMGSAFSDPQQLQRYHQLNLQYRGYGAFNDPMVSQKLNLTPDQQQQLSKFGETWSSQMTNLGPLYQTNPQAANQRFTEMQNGVGQNLNSVLTPSQQQTWQQMIGQPYSFPSSAYFQGRGNMAVPPVKQ